VVCNDLLRKLTNDIEYKTYYHYSVALLTFYSSNTYKSIYYIIKMWKYYPNTDQLVVNQEYSPLVDLALMPQGLLPFILIKILSDLVFLRKMRLAHSLYTVDIIKELNYFNLKFL